MEFFCYHRDRPGSTPLRERMAEQHWAYMDRFAERMIARGPTFAPDGTLTGSVHVLDLPDVAAARAFAFEEPGWQAGAYRDVLLRRWRNTTGRTMWQFTGVGPDRTCHLVLGFWSRRAPSQSCPTAPKWWSAVRSCRTTGPPSSAPPSWSRPLTRTGRGRSSTTRRSSPSRSRSGSSAAAPS